MRFRNNARSRSLEAPRWGIARKSRSRYCPGCILMIQQLHFPSLLCMERLFMGQLSRQTILWHITSHDLSVLSNMSIFS